MTYLIGLGNPGEKYQYTKHNLGHIVIDEVARNLTAEWTKAHFTNALVSKVNTTLLAKPLSFMNESGSVVRAVWNYYEKNEKVSPEKLIIVHDELDLPIGEYRVQQNRSAAGHKGVQSIIDSFQGSNAFTRYRIGIGRPTDKSPVHEFVLQGFSEEERKIISEVIANIVQDIKNKFIN